MLHPTVDAAQAIIHTHLTRIIPEDLPFFAELHKAVLADLDAVARSEAGTETPEVMLGLVARHMHDASTSEDYRDFESAGVLRDRARRLRALAVLSGSSDLGASDALIQQMLVVVRRVAQEAGVLPQPHADWNVIGLSKAA